MIARRALLPFKTFLRVTHVTLNHLTDNKLLNRIINSCPKLESLSLGGYHDYNTQEAKFSPVTACGLMNISLQWLTTLCLEGLSTVTDALLVAIATGCSKLQTIEGMRFSHPEVCLVVLVVF